MSRRSTHDTQVVKYAMEMMRTGGDSGPSLQDRVRILQEVRDVSPEASVELDEALVCDSLKLREGLIEAGENLAKAAQRIDQYAAMPLHPATFLQYDETSHGRVGLVSFNGGIRAVAMSEEAESLSLRCGDQVYLGCDQSLIVDTVNAPILGTGEIAELERVMPDGRVILKGRGDEQIIVDPATTLDLLGLRPGDPIRYDRSARVARELLEDSSPHSKYSLQEVPDLPLSAVAGDDSNLRQVLNALEVCLLDPDLAQLYGLEGSNTLLLYGPPGCGKTLLSQVACAEIARRSQRKAYFVIVQAAAFEAPYVGETQRQIRECFASLRQAAEFGPAVLFIDEIEAMGRVRGGAVGHHADKFLASVLTELDGFNRLKNIAVIAASNRKDLLDPALLSRMSVQIPVRRPGLRAARSILAVHLPEALPYNPNGASASATRSDIINAAVSRLYAANGGNELCTLKLADGKTRVVAAHELVSGRLLKQICQAAKQEAFHREASTGVRGIQLADIDAAVSAALDQLATSLSPANVHHHLDDLATDETVVSVAPHIKRVQNRRRYLCAGQGT